MKQLFLFVLLFISITLQAQYTTTLEVNYAPDAAIKAALEKNGTALLTEFNNAQGEKRSLSLKGIDIDNMAASSLYTMWEVCPFRCDELDVIQNCTNRPKGYQIRNIPVILEPVSNASSIEKRYQEIVLNYDQSGQIIDVCFALEDHEYESVLRSDLEVTDYRRRSLVLDFVEQFRTAYNRKDMDFMEAVFSDDALIVTGKVINRMGGSDEVEPKNNISLTTQSKRQYLTNLARVFQNNSYINVKFDDIKVNAHRSKKHIYGVTLTQHWNSGTYSDEGYLFLLWDFADEESPKIHVRTWQPKAETPKSDVFGLADFDVK